MKRSIHSALALIRSPAARPLRFLLVGGAATATHLASAALMLLVVPSALPYLINLFAFTLAFVVSFLGHRHITFGTHGSLSKFLVVALCGFALNNLILALGLHWNLSALVAITIATLCVPILTYIASALWAFKPAT